MTEYKSGKFSRAYRMHRKFPSEEFLGKSRKQKDEMIKKLVEKVKEGYK